MCAIHLIPDPERLDQSAALAEEYGAFFEYNDFYEPAVLDDPAECARRIRRYEALGRDRSLDTVHGAFLDVTVHSSDPRIRRVSEQRVRQSMDIARSLGVRGIVFHTGTIPNFRSGYYSRGWLERNHAFWTEICGEYPELEVLMENMFDMEYTLLASLSPLMAGSKNFGVCLDYAHARVFGGDPDQWLMALAPYVRHMHINDNDGLDDQHRAVGDGVIDWQRFDRCVSKAGIRPSVLVETRSLELQRKSLQFMQANGIYPFTKGDNEC